MKLYTTSTFGSSVDSNIYEVGEISSVALRVPKEKAEQIVRAVNMHDDLVAALKASWFSCTPETRKVALQLAHAALTAAGAL